MRRKREEISGWLPWISCMGISLGREEANPYKKGDIQSPQELSKENRDLSKPWVVDRLSSYPTLE